MAANLSCSKCRFWKQVDGEFGECLKNAPKVVAQASEAMGHPCRGVWPQRPLALSGATTVLPGMMISVAGGDVKEMGRRV